MLLKPQTKRNANRLQWSPCLVGNWQVNHMGFSHISTLGYVRYHSFIGFCHISLSEICLTGVVVKFHFDTCGILVSFYVRRFNLGGIIRYSARSSSIMRFRYPQQLLIPFVIWILLSGMDTPLVDHLALRSGSNVFDPKHGFNKPTPLIH